MSVKGSARLGILMLDTKFPRIRGDVGNPDTWGFPVQFGIVKGATPETIVCEDIEPFVQAFIEKGRSLIADGCIGIATTCGFLSLIRPRLSKALGVPVAASALEQALQISEMLPANQKVGILTISKSSLTDAHLVAAGVPADTPVIGLDGSEFANAILGNQEELNVEVSRREMLTAARDLVRLHPAVGAILLECTNMPPYARDIAVATGRPVYCIVTYLNWFYAGLAPAGFANS